MQPKVSEFLKSRLFKKIIVIALASLLVGAIVYTGIKNYRKTGSIVGNDLSISFVDNKNDPSKLDTDNDGVPDWEEKLLGLDPLKTDTDNDGVDDGMFVRNMRQLQEQRAMGGEGVTSNLTESEKLGRSLVTAILAIEQAGGEFDPETQDIISNNVAEYINNLTIGGTLYVRDSLTKVPDTKENVYAYRDELTSLLKTYPIDGKDIELLGRALQDGNQAYRISLERTAIKYDSLTQELKNLPVPSVIAGKHTEFLNSLASITGALKNLSQEEPDQVVTMSVLTQLQDIVETLVSSSQDLRTFFTLIEDESVFEE
jgi:hypothetical protein